MPSHRRILRHDASNSTHLTYGCPSAGTPLSVVRLMTPGESPLTAVRSCSANVTALAGLRNDSRFLQISAPMQPANSGGPLLDRSGKVVGVVVAQLTALGIASATGDTPQNVNFAIKASVAAAFLDTQRVLHGDGASRPALSPPDIAERAKGLAMQVACVR